MSDIGHDFRRDRASKSCFVCHDLWPSGEGVVAKFNCCSHCHFTAHSSCIEIAKQCYPCDKSKMEKIVRSNKESTPSCEGRIFTKVLHAYDIEVPPGISLYSIVKLSSLETGIRGSTAATGDRDCVWPISGTGDESFVSYQDKTSANELSLDVCIWKSVMRVFDTPLASCKIMLKPLFLHPNVSTERWFDLKDSEGSAFGKVLMNLKFVPFTVSDSPPLSVVSRTAAARDESPQGPVENAEKSESQLESVMEHVDSVMFAGESVPQLNLEPGLAMNLQRSDIAIAELNATDSKEVVTLETLSLGSIKNEDESEKAYSSTTVVENVKLTVDEAIPEEIKDADCLRSPQESATVSSLMGRSSEVKEIDNGMLSNVSVLGQSNLDKQAPKKKLTKSLFKLATPEKVMSRIDTPSSSSAFLTPSSIEQPVVLTKTDCLTVSANTDSYNSLFKEALVPNVSSQKQSPLTEEQNLHSENKSSLGEKPFTSESVSTSVPVDSAVVDKNTFPSLSLIFPENIFDDLGLWAKKTTNKLQGAVSTALKGQLEKKKGKEFTGFGVGKLYVNIISAEKTDAQDAAEGSYYVSISISDSDQENRTQTRPSSSSPVFNSQFQFIAPHFRSGIRLDLIDEETGLTVGSSYTSVYALGLRDADIYKNDWKIAKEEKYYIRNTIQSDEEPVGYITAILQFEEDINGLFTSAQPRLAPIGPEEELSVERLRLHIGRFQALISLFWIIYEDYCSIMNWDNPFLTAVLFVIFLYMVFKVDSEYGLSCPLFILVALMTRSWYLRKNGTFRQRWITKLHIEEKSKDSILHPLHRPVAYLRLSILGFRGFNSTSIGVAGLPLSRKISRPPYLKISYVVNEDNTNLASATLTSQKDKNSTGSSESVLLDEKTLDTIRSLGSADKDEYLESNLNVGDEKQMEEPTKEKSTKKEYLIACYSTAPSVFPTAAAEATGAGKSGISQLMSTLTFLRTDGVSKDELIQNVYGPWPRMKDEAAEFEVIGDEQNHQTMCPDNQDNDDICLVYPILQSVKLESFGPGTSSAPSKQREVLENWSLNESEIKLSLYGDHPLSSFIDSAWGMYASVPLGSLVDVSSDQLGAKGLQRERKGWLTVKEIAKTSSSVKSTGNSTSGIELGGDFDFDICNSESLKPKLAGVVSASPFRENGRFTKSVEVETTAQILVRMQLELPGSSSTTVGPNDLEKSFVLEKVIKDKEGKAENTLTVLFNMRDNIKYVQNLMSYILNCVESLKNLINWTIPSKTFPLYCALVCIWLATVLIPGRYLILAVGLYEFLFKFLPEFDPLPTETRFFNAIEALPNDNDIQNAYSREQKAYLNSKNEEERLRMRNGKLNLIFKSIWQGYVQIKALGIGNGVVWSNGYLVLQEARLVWWLRDEEIDAGKAPQQQLLLFGHAGITQPSPVDVREIGDDSRLVTIFGRDSHGIPHKWTVLCRDVESRQILISAVNALVDSHSLERIAGK